jgi:hypothetical protein
VVGRRLWCGLAVRGLWACGGVASRGIVHTRCIASGSAPCRRRDGWRRRAACHARWRHGGRTAPAIVADARRALACLLCRLPGMAPTAGKVNSVQVFGRKKTAVAVALCKQGKGLIKVNGSPLELVEPATLRMKMLEPIILLGREKFANLDIRIRVKGGGFTSQVYGEC